MLRHYPEQYDITLDSAGWADFQSVLDGVSDEMQSDVTPNDIRAMMKQSDKNRFELDTDTGRIRALYGHNKRLDVEVSETSSDSIPERLYHGTPYSNMDDIKQQGLQPQSRAKVHLTDSQETAVSVGERHLQQNESQICIIHIDTNTLQQNGFTIQNPSRNTYTIDEVPTRYFERTEVADQ